MEINPLEMNWKNLEQMDNWVKTKTKLPTYKHPVLIAYYNHYIDDYEPRIAVLNNNYIWEDINNNEHLESSKTHYWTSLPDPPALTLE